MVTNKQSQQQRKAVEDTATTILAYLDMGKNEEVQRLLAETDRYTLGMVVLTWFQIGAVRRGVKVTLTASTAAMDFFNAQAKLEDREAAEVEADKLTASLLFHLADNATDRYAKAWQRAVEGGPEISTAVAARMLGFTRSMLSDELGEVR